jgi:hypothetical protein
MPARGFLVWGSFYQGVSARRRIFFPLSVSLFDLKAGFFVPTRATRAQLLEHLFAGVAVTRHDAAHIHDHLDATLRPTVVLMNPPFSAAAHVDGRVADAALRHLASALARLVEGGRLVAITGASLSPDNPSWRHAFIRLRERGRVRGMTSATLLRRRSLPHSPRLARFRLRPFGVLHERPSRPPAPHPHLGALSLSPQ